MLFKGFVSDGVGHIPLWGADGRPRAWTIVDAEDYADAAQFRWHMSDSGYACRWYGGRPPKRKRDRLHRRVLGLTQGDPGQVDHINRERRDNRKANLRVLANDAQGKQNFSSNAGSTSPYRGVSWDKERGCWKAQAQVGGKNRLLGRYGTQEQARDAAVAWRRAHMPFAVD